MARQQTWRDLRTAAGLTIRELEEKAGINRGEISRIERGRSCPTPDQARRLLVAYGTVDGADLVGSILNRAGNG